MIRNGIELVRKSKRYGNKTTAQRKEESHRKRRAAERTWVPVDHCGTECRNNKNDCVCPSLVGVVLQWRLVASMDIPFTAIEGHLLHSFYIKEKSDRLN